MRRVRELILAGIVSKEQAFNETMITFAENIGIEQLREYLRYISDSDLFWEGVRQNMFQKPKLQKELRNETKRKTA